MFTARYALSPYLTQIRFVFKGLINHISVFYCYSGARCCISFGAVCIGEGENRELDWVSVTTTEACDFRRESTPLTTAADRTCDCTARGNYLCVSAGNKLCRSIGRLAWITILAQAKFLLNSSGYVVIFQYYCIYCDKHNIPSLRVWVMLHVSVLLMDHYQAWIIFKTFLCFKYVLIPDNAQ